MPESVLVLRLRSEADPIAGELSDASGSRRAFVGWAELVAAIDGARHEEAQTQQQGRKGD